MELYAEIQMNPIELQDMLSLFVLTHFGHKIQILDIFGHPVSFIPIFLMPRSSPMLSLECVSLSIDEFDDNTGMEDISPFRVEMFLSSPRLQEVRLKSALFLEPQRANTTCRTIDITEAIT